MAEEVVDLVVVVVVVEARDGETLLNTTTPNQKKLFYNIYFIIVFYVCYEQLKREGNALVCVSFQFCVILMTMMIQFLNIEGI